MTLKQTYRFILSFTTVMFLIACSDVKFSEAPRCEQEGIDCNQCVGDDCFKAFSDDIIIGPATVDILFVTDNSGSMSTEQAAMANRFPNFFDKIKDLDYRIAVITTDVSVSPNNGPKAANNYGAYQDGRFLEFASGEKVLSPSSSNVISKFRNTVKRDETVACENSGFKTASCPSPDERGIYAANMALDRNEENFFRDDAHLAIVILADEDERSRTRYSRGAIMGDIPGYPLENYDQPQTFIDRLNTYYPSKSLAVHAIITKPGDSSCKYTQDNQNGGVKGHYGYLYKQFAQLTAGEIGDICASDYGQQMGDIGSNIKDRVTAVRLDCRPRNDKVDIRFIPEPNPAVQITYDFQDLVIRFDRPLPPNTRVSLDYDCDI